MSPVCASSPSVLASKSPPCSLVIGDTIAEKKPKKPLFPPCSPVIGDTIAEKKPKKPLHVMR